MKDTKKLREELIKKLEKSSSLTREEAKKMLLDELSQELTGERAKRIRNAEERVKQEANERAREIIVDALKHGATSYVAEYTISTVRVPDEETKGRIIGKEGRNIRAFERACGVELELDETMEIRLSSFDPIRREIAKRSLERLIKDRRIQPSRIEEVVVEVRNDMDGVLLEEGKKIVEEVGEYNLPADLVKMIGKFKFRTSYGQNLALHTIEETKIAMSIARELGAEEEIVRLGGLLHDIGKVDISDEGTHVQKGVEIAKKFGLPKKIISIIAEHHEDKSFSSIESVIVWAADAISGSRPGARYEPHERYIQRMEKIEEIAKSFEGVEEALAFQAGRDVRVVVNPDKVDDDRLIVLARDITKRIEKEAEYAGQVKVTVIREIRAVETTAAK
ncbi:MAG: Ribonuclease Y [Candidatus Woesebacteria bacterium GW2011_GWB1_43_14]|uniref:Ribonuclease Y n=1 Tax=Candidatus Woesebacteria bacterium GW2011_GWB1_43_14 TaxID=1618578 RepID=A0A0G1GES5_9BACT|nr:MAG: Ribonuclease Y [Candidatus Woesebacteria bacterium GW2011_GWA1_39_11b]KKS78052.1 MAG: Ribonuclease Y [Candidatus Woesebacteria bacterium GW2011_GWC1_42_9]KKS97368.1 MAG: Ribonuclease Y [Candidatus Woesebacteria bacterium GW2011_GWB1_43_14]